MMARELVNGQGLVRYRAASITDLSNLFPEGRYQTISIGFDCSEEFDYGSKRVVYELVYNLLADGKCRFFDVGVLAKIVQSITKCFVNGRNV